MIRFLADENFDNDILDGIWHKNPDADIVRVQDTEVYRADDPRVLAWAAEQNRILLTHDVKTMTKYAYERIAAGLPMPGIFEVPKSLSIGVAIDELLIILGASTPEEWIGQVRYLPLR